MAVRRARAAPRFSTISSAMCRGSPGGQPRFPSNELADRGGCRRSPRNPQRSHQERLGEPESVLRRMAATVQAIPTQQTSTLDVGRRHFKNSDVGGMPARAITSQVHTEAQRPAANNFDMIAALAPAITAGAAAGQKQIDGSTSAEKISRRPIEGPAIEPRAAQGPQPTPVDRMASADRPGALTAFARTVCVPRRRSRRGRRPPSIRHEP